MLMVGRHGLRDSQVPGLDRTGRPGRLTTCSKEREKRQSEFGMEMQSNEVSGRNTDSPEAGSTRPLVPSTPAQGFIKERFCHKQSLPVTVQ